MALETWAFKPWRHVTPQDLGPANAIPSMLNWQEAQLYFWIAQHMVGTEGHIVDLGAFVGGSTAYLAQGNRQRGGQAKVFAFDQFRASEKVKARQLYPKGVHVFAGKDILPLARDFLRPWSGQICHRKGRIEDMPWCEGPISILVLDACKTADTMDEMAEIFFPHLMPGRSVIVQQDELHWKEPWIAVQMERLKDCFAPLCHVPGGAVAYRCIREVTLERLKRSKVGQMKDADMICALRASLKRLGPFDVAHKLHRQIDAMRLNPNVRKAWHFTQHAPDRARGMVGYHPPYAVNA